MKGTFTFDLPFLIASSKATLPPRTIMSATLALTFAAIPSSIGKTLFNLDGSLPSQLICGSSLILAPLAPPLKSVLLNVLALSHAVQISCLVVRPLFKISFSAAF